MDKFFEKGDFVREDTRYLNEFSRGIILGEVTEVGIDYVCVRIIESSIGREGYVLYINNRYLMHYEHAFNSLDCQFKTSVFD